MATATSLKVRELAGSGVVLAARPLHALMAAPSLLFLVTLAVMLFRPPDLQFYSLDRVAFALLVFIVLLRALLLRHLPRVVGRVTWPMLGLLLLALAGVLAHPNDSQTWSLFAAKWVVPFTLFHLAGLVFDDDTTRRRFETFLLVVLAYLVFTAIASLAGATALIFPRYILDESLGIHADRARGPFLQAVANGVTLNLLGIVALDAFRRDRFKGTLAALLLAALPVAILATLTRAVWLSFAGSVAMLLWLSSSLRLRRACLCLIAASVIGILTLLSFRTLGTALTDRLEESTTVEYRVAMYEAGWQMFLEKPLAGWGAYQTPFELAKRISGFHQDAFYFHNTYLELAVEYGAISLGLYAWMMAGMFRLGRRRGHSEGGDFLDGEFRSAWPVLLCVYLVNGTFVVMNYQFVNGLLFTLAGMLAAQQRVQEASPRNEADAPCQTW